MGAVTTERTPVPGCRVQPLGVMRYIPVASKAYINRHLPDGFSARAAAEAPSLAWNRDDALQDELVRKAFRRHIARSQHFVPTAEGFAAPSALVWAGGCSLTASPHRIWLTGRVRIADVHLMCRCTGSAGS